jgi:CO/xanthine dehydrogenase FAD-binding subunit
MHTPGIADENRPQTNGRLRRRQRRPQALSDSTAGHLWARLSAVEAALRGRPPNADVFRGAAALAADGAKPLRENGFKVELLKRIVERQLATVAAML